MSEVAAGSLAGRPSVARRKDPQKSRITNGTRLLPNVDGRSPWVRRLKDLIALHVADLGGDQNISEAERAIIRRAAVIITELERMERDFALSEGAPGVIELEAYQRAANSMRRLLESIGLKRRARDVTTPTLAEYLRSAAHVTAADADAEGGATDEPAQQESDT